MAMRTHLPIALALVLCAAPAAAQAPLLSGLGGPRGYGTNCLHPNDDSYSLPIDLRTAFPAGLQFFDRVHTQVFVNTNGNITFNAGVSTYTPRPFPVANQPMIAPFWADVDIRADLRPGSDGCGHTGTRGVCENPSSNGVWWHLAPRTGNQPAQMVVTWDNVGYYRCREDKRMSFQLILREVPSCGGGATDFDVEFRFNRCEWETGDASGGSGGFGGTPAQSGFDAGNSRDYVALPGSRSPGIATRLCTESNVGEPGVWRFQIRSGTVVCPDAGQPCNTGMVGACGEGVMQCVGSGVVCQPVISATPETCDAIDNDCDGVVDEGDSICPGTQVCDRGRCIDTCFEGGCPPGQECTSDGVCLDIGCDGLECPPGQRCVAGVCGDACAGVVCPIGLSCHAGRCLDLCADISCDPECSVCSQGQCVARCDLPGGGCGPGETCTPGGLCVPTDCVGVQCPEEGQVCVGGRGCVDACEGAICPAGDICTAGRCERPRPMSVPDAGGIGDGDGGGQVHGDGGLIGGDPPRPSTECLCSAPGAGRDSAPWLLFGGLGLALMLRRRRRG